MYHRLFTVVVGSQWRTFCGLSADNLLEETAASLDDLGYEYSVEDVDTTSAERMMLGSPEFATEVTVSEPASFDVTIVETTIDPMTGVMFKLFFEPDRQDEVTAGVCVVDVAPVDDDTRPVIGALLNCLIKRRGSRLWQLSHHPSFRLAVLLRLKVRLFWQYWTAYDDERRTAG